MTIVAMSSESPSMPGLPEDDLTADAARAEAGRCEVAADQAANVSDAATWRELADRWRKLATQIGSHLDGANF